MYTIPLLELRQHIGKYFDQVKKTGQSVNISRNGAIIGIIAPPNNFAPSNTAEAFSEAEAIGVSLPTPFRFSGLSDDIKHSLEHSQGSISPKTDKQLWRNHLDEKYVGENYG